MRRKKQRQGRSIDDPLFRRGYFQKGVSFNSLKVGAEACMYDNEREFGILDWGRDDPYYKPK